MFSDTEVHELRFAKELLNPVSPLETRYAWYLSLQIKYLYIKYETWWW
jgi:hypothetical protein